MGLPPHLHPPVVFLLGVCDGKHPQAIVVAFKADVSTIIENDCAAKFFALVCFATISTPAWNAEALFQVLVEVLATMVSLTSKALFLPA